MMNTITTLLLFLLFHPSHPISSQPILSIIMVCNRQYPIVQLTCRIHNWSSHSELCTLLHSQTKHSCLNKPVASNEFLIHLDVGRDMPIVINEETVATYTLNLLGQPKDSAKDFCHRAAKLLTDLDAYDKLQCLEMTTSRFTNLIATLSIQPLNKRVSSSQGLPPALLLSMNINQCNIPKILHQTWKTKTIPTKFQQWRKSWLTNHPDWEVYPIWSDQDNLNLVQRYFPELMDTYTSFPHHILRVDFVRYLMMYIYGGVYADLDLESLKSMNTILQQGQGQGQGKKPHIVLGMESVDTETIDISFIASVPYHKLWLRVARAAIVADGLERVRDVLHITGNKMFTAMVNEELQRSDITSSNTKIQIYDLPTLYAPAYSTVNGTQKTMNGYVMYKNDPNNCRCGSVEGKSETRTRTRKCISCQHLFPASHIVHHETGTWVKSFWNQ